MEQARIEHAPNGRLLTYITIADAMVNKWIVDCVPILKALRVLRWRMGYFKGVRNKPSTRERARSSGAT